MRWRAQASRRQSCATRATRTVADVAHARVECATLPRMPRRPPARLVRALVGRAARRRLRSGLLAATGTLDDFERDLVDERFEVRGSHADAGRRRRRASTRTPSPELDSPFRRAFHARAIRALLAAGARTVAYDVQFADRDPNAPRRRRALLRAAANRRVVLGDGRGLTAGRPACIGAQSAAPPRRRVGSVLLPIDADGVWRRHGGARAGRCRHFAVAGRERRRDVPASVRSTSRARRGRSARSRSSTSLDGRFDAAAVRGRIVVVGATALTLKDAYATSPGGGLMPGAEIHANAIQTVLDDYPLRDALGLRSRSCWSSPPASSPRSRRSPARRAARSRRRSAPACSAPPRCSAARSSRSTPARSCPSPRRCSRSRSGRVGAVALTYVFEVRARRRAARDVRALRRRRRSPPSCCRTTTPRRGWRAAGWRRPSSSATCAASPRWPSGWRPSR